MTYGQSKCWNCERNANECSWLEDFTPVKGWSAFVGKSPYGSQGKVTIVYDCPNFKEMVMKKPWTHLKKQYGN